MNNFIAIISAILILIFTISVFAIIIVFPFMWLWNWLMPTIFGLIKINIWQSLGLIILSSILFKSSAKTETKE